MMTEPILVLNRIRFRSALTLLSRFSRICLLPVMTATRGSLVGIPRSTTTNPFATSPAGHHFAGLE
mgnify:FL=1